MAASIFTDCSSMQGSTTSSSSDMLTLTTAASSWCAIPASTRIRIVRLLRPHTRRILVTPGTIPSYGFAVRGGKEFSTGFFVSSVDRNSEAEQKGLRIGDQILRINGFRIDDAIHKEFVQLVSYQERLTLKVRSVGMLPIKDKENDCLTWNVVKTPSISTTTSECSYQSSERTERNHTRNHSDRVINVVLNVAPRTKLGLGICKGPEWKPGIFVQFTKEKSVAREAGLRPGDQILTVNSIDFSDVLFSEAVAVMKSSNKLDMTVHTSAGCDLFPGESSGYNSSASSVTGDQSPCWADVKSKRLTAVREETSTGAQGATTNWNQPLYANERRGRTKSISERVPASNSTLTTNLPIRQTSFSSNTPSSSNIISGNNSKEINKTIIKLSESGTSINNTYVANQVQSSATGTIRKTLTTTMKENHHRKMEREGGHMAAGGGTLTKMNQGSLSTMNSIPPPPPPLAMSNQHHHHHHHHHNHQKLTFSTESTTSSSSSSNTYTKKIDHDDEDDGDIRIGGVAATMQRYQYANMQIAKQKHSGSTSSESTSYSTMNLNVEMEKSNSNTFDGGSLSSAITEELKKRKAKRQPHNNSNSNNNNCNKELTPRSGELKPNQYESKREANINNSNSNATNAPHASHDIDHKNSINNSNNNNINNTLNAVGDHHSALMNEFKQAHKRMFKNGFKENGGDSNGNQKDRQEALMNTTILDDAGTCRSKGPKHIQAIYTNDTVDSREPLQTDTYARNSRIPEPPPIQMSNNAYKAKTAPQSPPKSQSIEQQNGHRLSSNSSHHHHHNNEAIYSRTSKIPSNTNSNGNHNSANANHNPSNPNNNVPQTNRHTLRLGTVTIGEYRNNTNFKREPEKFDFIGTQKKGRDSGETTPTNESLQSELQNTLSRANLRKSNGSSYLEHQRNCPLAQQQQQQIHPLRQSEEYSHNGFTVEEIAKKLQKTSLNDNNNSNTNNRPMSSTNVGATTGVGILKNGNRNNANGSSSSKSTEKSIKFG